MTKSILSATLRALLLLSAGQATLQPKLDDLDALFAPIALYPDALLGPLLVSAANPATVGALSEWLRSHEAVKGTALQDAARASKFGESYVALVLFPPVVHTMAEQIPWTTKVGKAFAADRSAAFASIQRLRAKARDAGKLKTNDQQSVTTETTATGQSVIVIEPANPQLVYVPQYNPQTVYVPSTVIIKEEDDSDAAVAAGLIGFTAGIALGAAINDNYYYGPYGWGGGFRMYDDDFDDWYDHREDAREDWMDNREDLAESETAAIAPAARRNNAPTGRSPAPAPPPSAPASVVASAPQPAPTAPPPAHAAPARTRQRPPAQRAPALTRSPAIRTAALSAPPAHAGRAAEAAHAAAGGGDDLHHSTGAAALIVAPRRSW